MKNKGFTLIELLAVIVILAVIALIATPMIMDVITKTKQQSAIASGRSIVHAGELAAIGEENITSLKYDENSGLQFKGKQPSKFLLEFNENMDSKLNAWIDGYCVVKNYGEDDLTIDKDKKTEEECLTKQYTDASCFDIEQLSEITVKLNNFNMDKCIELMGTDNSDVSYDELKYECTSMYLEYQILSTEDAETNLSGLIYYGIIDSYEVIDQPTAAITAYKCGGTYIEGYENEYIIGKEMYPVIPSEIDGKTIVAIDELAFGYGPTYGGSQNNTVIWGVDIPDSVVLIDALSFTGNDQFHKLILPKNISIIMYSNYELNFPKINTIVNNSHNEFPWNEIFNRRESPKLTEIGVFTREDGTKVTVTK